jgi:hypothetical protein
MDVIDYELKRYEHMKNDLESKRKDSSKEKDMDKSTEYLDTIIDQEKPKDVSVITKLINIIFSSYECILLDGATKTSHS